jgi:hypothetical protein
MNTAHNTPENAKVLLLNHFIFSNTGTSDKELKGELLQAMGTVTLEWEKQEIKEKILNFAQELLQIARHTNHIWESGRQTTQDEKEQIATSNAQKLNTLIDTTADDLIKCLITDKLTK